VLLITVSSQQLAVGSWQKAVRELLNGKHSGRFIGLGAFYIFLSGYMENQAWTSQNIFYLYQAFI